MGVVATCDVTFLGNHMVSIRSNICALLSVITRSDQLCVAALWYRACLCVAMAFFYL